MRKRRRSIEVFGLAFLDCICCGFGAVILLYVMTTQEDALTVKGSVSEAKAETSRIAERLEESKEKLAELRNSIEDEEVKLAEIESEERQLLSQMDQDTAELSDLKNLSSAELENANELKSDLEAVKQEIAQLKQRQEATDGGNINDRQGDERRHYVTGLRVDGQRSVILFDCSLSTTAPDLVTYQRYYGDPNQPKAERLTAPKRVRMLDALDWLVATSESPLIQVIFYNEEAQFGDPATAGDWIEKKDAQKLQDISDNAWELIPEGGADMTKAVELALQLDPRPDNIYVITDSVPTLSKGRGPTEPSYLNTRYFAEAVRAAGNTPLHFILFPLGGDSVSSFAFWQAARMYDGSFFCPAPDWPN